MSKSSTAIVALLLFMLMACKHKATQNEATGRTEAIIQLKDSVCDFGDIPLDAVSRSHSFFLRNIGKEPLIVHSIDSHCSCTTITYCPTPTAPGDSLELKVSYDPRGRPPGAFTKQILIYSSAINGITRLTIKGHAISK